ncbi:HlyD family type I secretion periplasmic adaptor subunit [Paraburkholderia bryophila]|uniref:HlyD family type I secretion periplasmic adaptor subunit n=1 Tax=Paraburkholderia bryophila TaxID=420952 RepID=UPI00234B920E|nr:HlyD family type I secretion periplasmic adaptor subunit [Paraburkholderia bryophila]WCM18702.1 HlyD family type I secretion periplasmic adaptor subunit [Paraburkholderia bryophila]
MYSQRLDALVALCSRYAAVLRSAWAMRDQLDSPARYRHELQFLPAQLELVETPVHPAAHWAMRTVVALVVVVIVIAIFGKLDIVATAQGKLAPNAHVKLIQPAITGVVRQIAVYDGERVAAGQLLMELDTAQAAADADKARSARVDAALALARAGALLAAQQSGGDPSLPAVAGASPPEQIQSQHFAEGQFREYQDKLLSAKAEWRKRQAELDSTQQEIAKLRATAPLARQQADNYRALVAQKYVANNDYLDKERTALEQEHELSAQRAHSNELAEGIVEQRADVDSITSQFRREQLDAYDKAQQQLAQNRADETKADTRQKLLSLTAPVAGTVQQLRVHTLGGVVTTAQSLMEIVPDDTVEVEASVENRDIGFVKVGQTAVVKIEAFPYTRYGYLTGQVISVSNDAAQDKKLGLMFPARVRLASNRIKVEDKWVNLTPGMEVTVEINTGKRSVAEYFLGPLVRTAQESMRER